MMDYLTRYNQARCDGGETGTWRRQAYAVIAAVLAKPDFSERETLERIDAAYPFGRREHYPYKAWIKERRHAMVALGLRKAGPKVARRMLNAEQMALWED